MAVGLYISAYPPDGTSFGQDVSEKISLYGKTPIVQRAGSAQASVTTTASTTSTPAGYSTTTQADAIVTLVNELRAAMVAFGVIKGAA